MVETRGHSQMHLPSAGDWERCKKIASYLEAHLHAAGMPKHKSKRASGGSPAGDARSEAE